MRVISLILFLHCIISLKSQIIPIEILSGNRNYYQQFSVYRESSVERVGFFNTSSLLFLYSNVKRSELMSQSYLTYSLNNSFKIGLGTFYASAPGLIPSLNLQYIKKSKYYFFIASPRVDIKVNPTFDLMTSLEMTPAINESLKLYLRFQSMFNYSSKQHNRSYQYFRLGLQYKNNQFGLAINRDAYGRNYDSFFNYGLFYKINIK